MYFGVKEEERGEKKRRFCSPFLFFCSSKRARRREKGRKENLDDLPSP